MKKNAVMLRLLTTFLVSLSIVGFMHFNNTSPQRQPVYTQLPLFATEQLALFYETSTYTTIQIEQRPLANRTLTRTITTIATYSTPATAVTYKADSYQLLWTSWSYWLFNITLLILVITIIMIIWLSSQVA